MKRFIPALAGVAALSLLSGCVYEGYGRPYPGNYGYGGRNYGYGDYGYDPYGGYGGYSGYGGYGYPYYDYYGTPFTTFGLGLGLGYYDFGGFRRGYGGYYRGGNGGGGFARGGGGERGRFSGRVGDELNLRPPNLPPKTQQLRALQLPRTARPHNAPAIGPPTGAVTRRALPAGLRGRYRPRLRRRPRTRKQPG